MREAVARKHAVKRERFKGSKQEQGLIAAQPCHGVHDAFERVAAVANILAHVQPDNVVGHRTITVIAGGAATLMEING
jgi:hypothetical protein